MQKKNPRDRDDVATPPEGFTVAEISRAVSDRDLRNVGPVFCPDCRRAYYLVAPFGTGWKPGDELLAECTHCGRVWRSKDGILNVEPRGFAR